MRGIREIRSALHSTLLIEFRYITVAWPASPQRQVPKQSRTGIEREERERERLDTEKEEGEERASEREMAGRGNNNGGSSSSLSDLRDMEEKLKCFVW